MSAAHELPGVDDPAQLIHDITQVDPAWLTNLLQNHCGVDAEVRDVTVSEVCSGQIGVSYRVMPEYLRAPAGSPRSLVIKLAAGSDDMRALMSPGFAWEIGFYQQLAHRVAIRTARCWHAAISTDQKTFTLVMEDLAPAAPGNQLAGCDLPRARVAVLNLAGLHAPMWNDPLLLGELAWLQPFDADGIALIVELYRDAVDTFVERYAGELGADVETLRATKDLVQRWTVEHQRPFSVIHGDYRLDNLMFAPGGDDVTAVDWQTTAVGHPLRDVAYFLSLSLPTELRRQHERALLVEYHDALLEQGVRDFTFTDCMAGYRVGMLQGPLVTILGCVLSSAGRTTASDAMFLSMITRSCAAMRDVGTLEADAWLRA